MSFDQSPTLVYIRRVDFPCSLEQSRPLCLRQLTQEGAVRCRFLKNLRCGLQLRSVIVRVAVMMMIRHFVQAIRVTTVRVVGE